jgi:ATPase family associated with various cellular activities (AAA)
MADGVGMRREPSLTFEGALKLLGHYEPKWIEKIDTLLGGVILAGGATAGLVVLGASPLAPLAAFGLVWGWVEQKGLAIDLLRKAVVSVSGKVAGTKGLERRELIAAAHSTIVVAAFFEAFRDHVGKESYGHLRITADEKIALLNRMGPGARDRVIGDLYTVEISAPSAARGFEENVQYVRDWQKAFSGPLRHFLGGLLPLRHFLGEVPADGLAHIDWSAILEGAAERYRSHYLQLAATVREFAVWAELGEHAATRTAVRDVGAKITSDIVGLGEEVAELGSDVTGLRADVVRLSAHVTALNGDITAALNGPRDALGGVTALLLAVGRHTADGDDAGQVSGLRKAVGRANAGVLDGPIIPVDQERYPSELTIPQVSEIYINPRYRVAEFNDQARPADEEWWGRYESHHDFDVLLTTHVTSPDATRRPMLLLGHPGAGKSLLTKVFAARLPVSEYTVVRVPLRRVSADARVDYQIEEALRQSTDRLIGWSDLADQSSGTIRVVLLDGLDELLQASEHDRSRYLQDVADFQDREAMQRRPVVVVVTSRTVVVNRVHIPFGSVIVKLDPFNDADIEDWLGRWKRVNGDAIAAGTVGELTASAVRRQPELAEQPLLLLMLAIYAADQNLPTLDEDMATAELYRRLLEGFARREADKDIGLGRDPYPDEIDQRVQDHLDRLVIAALGMFNRGRQDISEEELGRDLEVLEPRLMERVRAVEAGRRIIREFFFVHAPEARTLTGHSAGHRLSSDLGIDGDQARQRARTDQPQRAYEFLHATFGEYLVARRVIDELVDAAVRAFSGRRGPTEPDDDLLFALLSHQTLAARRSMLNFAKEIFADLSDKVREQVFQTLEVLVGTYRNRHGSDLYTAYRPTAPDQVHQLARYSANLVALRVVLEREADGVSLEKLLSQPQNTMAEWQTTPLLWKSSLDTDEMESMLTLLELISGPLRLRANKSDLRHIPFEILLARLVGDEFTENRLRYGTAIFDGVIYYLASDSWNEMMLSWLIPAIAGIGPVPTQLPAPPYGTADKDIAHIAELVFKYLRSASYSEPRFKLTLKFLFTLPRVFEIDHLALTSAVLGRPQLRAEIPELQDFEIYGPYSEIVHKGDTVNLTNKDTVATLQNPSDETVAVVKHVLRKPLDLEKGGSLLSTPGLGYEQSAEDVFD